MPDVVILCGGRGTRAYPDTLELPKPLLTIAGVPVVEHVIGIYARHGYRRVILASGYLGERLAEHFATPRGDYDVEVVDTGLDTDTGERLRRVRDHLREDRFFATYADGLADIDLDALLARHLGHGGAATVTTVPLPSQYGVLESDPVGRVARFREKPRLVEHWINGGFFVFERRALDMWEGENLEREVLPALSARDELFTYPHSGFWKSMDTFKDREELARLAEGGEPPWEATARSEHVTAQVGTSWAPPVSTDETSLSPESAEAARNGATNGKDSAAAALSAPVALLPVPTGNGASGNGASGNGASGNGSPNGSPEAIPTETPPHLAVAADLGLPRVPGRAQTTRRMRLVTTATVLIDLLAVYFAYRLAGSIRTGFLGERLVGSDRAELLLTWPVWLGAFAAYGLYSRHHLVAASEEARRVLQAVGMGAVLVVVLTFALRQDVGRSFVAVVTLFSLVFVTVGRFVVRATIQWLSARGVLGMRVLVVGSNGEARALIRRLERQPWLGCVPVGLVTPGNDHGPEPGIGEAPVVGCLADIEAVVAETEASAVIIESTDLPSDQLADLCTDLHGLGLDVRVTPGLPLVSASRVSVAPLDGLAVLSIRRNHQLSRGQAIVKRAFDLLVGGLMALVSIPLVALFALAVRFTSGGPAFFRQVRAGEDGKPFVLYKLRTMCADAEDRVIDLRDQNVADGVLFKIEQDPRVTRIGRHLRRWGIDELPQLWNVLRGDMSLVGPRPPLPGETVRYDEWIRGRLGVKPGITGLWQVKGGHVLSFDDYVRYDLFYVENWSLGLDVYVMASTLPALLFRRGMA
jgi:exopolysaccharide biosynthesis polyprenyl glycosylphosphotransferase